MNEEKYYNIKYKNKPKAYGIVVKVKNNKLEIFVGTKQDLIEFECNLDNRGNLTIGGNYFYNSIEKKQAQKIKNKFDWHNGMQTIFSGTGYDSTSPNLFGPGGEQLS